MSIELEALNIINSLKQGIEGVTNKSYSDLTEAIQSLKNGYNIESGIVPSGTKEITENGTHDVTDYKWASVNIQQGIIPIGNLSDSIILRNSDNYYHSATIPSGYYVNDDINISDWKSGILAGNGTNGGTYNIPYSSIGFTPKWVAIIAISDSHLVANTILSFISTNSVSSYIYTGSKGTLSSTYNLNISTSYKATFNSNGVTFPSIGSSYKYSTSSYRWFAMR